MSFVLTFFQSSKFRDDFSYGQPDSDEDTFQTVSNPRFTKPASQLPQQIKTVQLSNTATSSSTLPKPQQTTQTLQQPTTLQSTTQKTSQSVLPKPQSLQKAKPVSNSKWSQYVEDDDEEQEDQEDGFTTALDTFQPVNEEDM